MILNLVYYTWSIQKEILYQLSKIQSYRRPWNSSIGSWWTAYYKKLIELPSPANHWYKIKMSMINRQQWLKALKRAVNINFKNSLRVFVNLNRKVNQTISLAKWRFQVILRNHLIIKWRIAGLSIQENHRQWGRTLMTGA